MADPATYIGIEPRTIKVTAVDVARGLRVSRNSSGECAVTGISTRGDYVTLTDISASTHGAAASASGGGRVPAVASENVADGDLAYSAADGKTSKTATSAVVMGRWCSTTAANTLGTVELFPVA